MHFSAADFAQPLFFSILNGGDPVSLPGYFIINAYSIAILAVIFIQSRNSTEKNLLPQRLFIWILLVTAVMLVMDTLSRLDGHPGTLYAVANQTGNFLIFLLSPALPSLWLLYVYNQVDDTSGNIRLWLSVTSTLTALNAVMLILSQFSGWYYIIGADNIYHRGPLYWFPVTITAVLTAAAFILVLSNRKKIMRKHFISLLLFPVPPIVCIVLQVTYYGTSLILNGAVLSILIAFVTIQNECMHTDYLTGVYNRKRLEAYLRKKINSVSKKRTFSAILLDMDDFKSINDTFGHNKGDQVLAESSSLLKSCLRSDDFIARYGGDEFYIILNISDPQELEDVVCRIRNCMGAYNGSSSEPYEINFSIGYDVYDFRLCLGAQEFLRHLDSLLYADKRSGKDDRQ
jgi:diguanylate cyclase (GGDEF)-like protein